MSGRKRPGNGIRLKSISDFDRLPFNKEDVFQVVSKHPGMTPREILSFLGYGTPTHDSRQRINGFLINIKMAAERLQKEGRIKIVSKIDRFLYFPEDKEKVKGGRVND